MEPMNRKGLSLILATALALFLVPTLLSILSHTQTAYAATFTVNLLHDNGDGVCDVSSCTIRDAILTAANGDDITIPAGNYTLSPTVGALTVTKDLTFNGNSATDTFIDAQGNSRVLNVTAGAVVFNGLTIQNGVAVDGAGIRISGATTNVTLNNSTVFSNSATTNGGGVYLQSGILTLQNSEVVTNTAALDGGGIYTLRGDITSDNSSINYNSADRAGGVFVNLDTASLTLNSGEIAFNTGSTEVDLTNFPGGGIFVAAGTATLNGGEIKSNHAYRGGGILVSSGQVTLNDAQIISNTATYGGGVYVLNTGSWFTQTAGIIATNQSTATVEFGGGGLYIFNGNAALLGGSVMTNTAASFGGGMEVRFGTLLVDGATIADNQSGAMGGGIYNSGGDVTIQDSLVSGNIAASNGGGIATSYDDGPSQTSIENSAILSNAAGSVAAGGGVSINNDPGLGGGVITLTNVTLSGNSAGNGAGLATEESSTATLTNVTISENSANNNGGGLSNSTGTLTVGNSIIYNNTAPSGNNCSGTISSAGNNMDGDGSCNLNASGDTVDNPLLQPLALNGGDTLNYALGSGSPAIDAGSDTLCPATDQRGNLRPIDGDGDSTPTCDIGAYEDGVAFFISDASLTEGDAGSAQMSFTVTRSFVTDTTYTVDYETVVVPDSAEEGVDYTAVPTATLTFLPNDMTQTINIEILGDTLDEDDETFTVQLSNQSPEISIGDAIGIGTILDNDAPPSLTINDMTFAEADGDSVTAVLTATLSAPSGKTIEVDYATMDVSAEAGEDYTNIDTTTLIFDPGEIEKPIEITINDDALDEIDETFTVELSNANNVTLSDSSGQVTITDDDDEPELSIANAEVNEGDDGTTTSMDFVVTLSAPSGKTITVNYMTNGTSGSATVGSDYEIAIGTLTFNPDETEKIISVTINGDDVDEVDETFQVDLSNEVNVTIQPSERQAMGTINDDDPLPTANISDATVTEGDSGMVTAVFTVTLSHASEKMITINYSSANDSAIAGEDFTAVPASVLTFNPGDPLSQTINVTVQGDEDTEPDEQFFINLTGANGNVTLGDSQGVGTILNDDGTFIYLPFVINP
ncbi:MAG: hypothetical protein CL608_22825 [Anaerolineaceae bacterium]|nr:hypothetical protein [Anaerolineaceae bacterium]